MKKLFFIFFTVLFFTTKTEAQVYHPMFAYYNGYGTMAFPDMWGNVMCIYYGNIHYGKPHGEGYIMWADGSFYYGGFYEGFAHGNGVVGNYTGYIAGAWNMGDFIGVNNSYDNRNYTNTVQDVRQQQNSNSNLIAMNNRTYNIEKLDASSEMGQVLLGKVVTSQTNETSNNDLESASITASATIEKIWVDHNVDVNDYGTYRKGMKIHVFSFHPVFL